MKLTEKQEEAQTILAGDATHLMLVGGSRSGKTFLLTRNVVARALKAPKSRHVILRYRFNAVKASIVMDTFPKVMDIAFPGMHYDLNKSDWYVTFPNDSQIWFGGLDDKERTEKILGTEYATIYLNEISQIPYESRNMALSRLAQKVSQSIDGNETSLKPRMYYDCNPPNKAHWSYRLFIEGRDPETKLPLNRPKDYDWFKINPADNTENISADYLDTLKGMSARMRKRFLDGEFADTNPSALFSEEAIDKWRVTDGIVPDLIRVIVGVDPSGSGDVDNADNDEIGIFGVGVGTDGNGYVLEDGTGKAGPATWGKIATDAYERHQGDAIVAEINYGGAMVQAVIKAANPRVNYKQVTASRGKAVRAEPFSALYEQGKIRHVGRFLQLEDELMGFSTNGYTGDGSPNRADALIWALAELFPGLVKNGQKNKPIQYRNNGVI